MPSRLAFLLGHPVSHSLSPAMHNAAFARLHLPYLYAPLDVEPRAVSGAVELLRIGNVLGANVTVPHKQAVIAHLDQVEKDALWLSSVNTIYKRGGKLCGTSTDGPGFLKSLGPWAREVKGASALLVGAGGGSRAVAGALLTAGISRLSIMDLDPKRVRELIRMLKRRSPRLRVQGVSKGEAEKEVARCGFIVQATPVGLHRGDPSPLCLKRATKGTLAVDLVYHRRTAFLKEAADRSLRTLSGLGMLLHQGALSFEKWTGRSAPVEVMEQALRRALSRKT